MNKRRKQDAIENPALSGPSGHEVGTEGERFIEELCKLPFGRDFLFANPKYKKGQNEREVCDLLLLLDNYVVVVQIKTAEPASKSEWDEQRWADWRNKKIDESLKQLRGGLRAMLDGRASAVENDRQGRVEIDPKKLTHLFGIVIVDGPTLGHWGAHPVVEVAGRSVPVLLTSHQHMIEIVTELSTPMDLIDYLGAHARFFEHNELLGANELDLLAGYKAQHETLDMGLDEGQTMHVHPGSWDRYTSSVKRQQRARLDRNSSIVDAMIDKLGSIRIAEPAFVQEMREREGKPEPDKADKQRAINELARLDRMARRHIGDKIMEKTRLCLETGRNRRFAFQSRREHGTWHVFVVSQASRPERLRYVDVACQCLLLAKGVGNVFGYGLPPVHPGIEFSMDAVWWNVDPQKYAEHMGNDLVQQAGRYFTDFLEVEHTEFGGPEAPPTPLPLDPGDPPDTVS